MEQFLIWSFIILSFMLFAITIIGWIYKYTSNKAIASIKKILFDIEVERAVLMEQIKNKEIEVECFEAKKNHYEEMNGYKNRGERYF
jgi:cytochrome b561